MRKKITLQNISIFILLLIIFFLLFTITRAIDGYKLVRQADSNYFFKPKLALQQYQEAQNKFPLLRFDKELLQKQTKLQETINKYNNGPSLIIFFKTGASNTDIETLTNKIRSIKGVTKVTFISQQEAFKIYKEQNGPDIILLELVTPDLLPASLQVYISDPHIQDSIYEEAEGKLFIESVVKPPVIQ